MGNELTKISAYRDFSRKKEISTHSDNDDDDDDSGAVMMMMMMMLMNTPTTITHILSLTATYNSEETILTNCNNVK